MIDGDTVKNAVFIKRIRHSHAVGTCIGFCYAIAIN